ncbi:MAG: NADP-dependent isocitrate dehydrogenase [Alphaproteobacteria bacterium GM7ARS4]|nr:NADP-dependent isocitrate dehydrogenase [Alphaproteobacteria bacterium GM7ARS4]
MPFKKIRVKNPVVVLEGDEMAAILWQKIKECLILPFLDLPILSFDLSILHRDATDDAVTIEAARAIARHGVGIKCATITANAQRQEEFHLKQLLPSPNGTIRQRLNGIVFREPIVFPVLTSPIPQWRQPIIIARHAYGDQYAATEMSTTAGTQLQMADTRSQNAKRHAIHTFTSDGVAMALYNEDTSIISFARTCFRYGLERSLPVYFASKDTILRVYDGRFRALFADIYETEFRQAFQEKKIFYQYRLIDDMVAMALRSHGGFIWACKNYDGDVMSDMVAQGFGSLGMMTSILMTEDGNIVESEAAHGTVTNHFRQHQQGLETSTNPIASIFAWSRGLLWRGRFDHHQPLQTFCALLEQACMETLHQGIMTKDLALLTSPAQTWHTTDQFIRHVARTLSSKIDSQ